MFDETEIPAPSETQSEKRNCGRTGPTSPEGRAASSKNAIKHGSCSQTLILPYESEESWLLLLNRWLQTYQPAEDSLLHDFVLKTAQAEWYRIRAQGNYDRCACSTQVRSTFNWTPDEIKKHDLALRYKNSAERSFQREYRQLEQFHKLHPSVASRPADPDPTPEVEPEPELLITAEDPDSPTGISVIHEVINGVENTVMRPYYPKPGEPPAPKFGVGNSASDTKLPT
jgi:hypothetical protein